MGVHYRFDSTEGLILGETVAVRMLHQVRVCILSGNLAKRLSPSSICRPRSPTPRDVFQLNPTAVVVRYRAGFGRLYS